MLTGICHEPGLVLSHPFPDSLLPQGLACAIDVKPSSPFGRRPRFGSLNGSFVPSFRGDHCLAIQIIQAHCISRLAGGGVDEALDAGLGCRGGKDIVIQLFDGFEYLIRTIVWTGKDGYYMCHSRDTLGLYS